MIVSRRPKISILLVSLLSFGVFYPQAWIQAKSLNDYSINSQDDQETSAGQYRKLVAMINKLSPQNSHTDDGLKVVMAAVELGPLPGLKTTLGQPLDITAGGVATVLYDVGNYYPKFLQEQNGGSLTIIGLLMKGISTKELRPGEDLQIEVDGNKLTVGTFEFMAASGTKYIFLSHPLFQYFSVLPSKHKSIYYMQAGEKGVDSQEEQRIWSAFNQAIAKVFKNENGDIFVPHDNHTSPATFYIHKHEHLVPITSKPLVHNEGYTGTFGVAPEEKEKLCRIWNITLPEMDEYFMNSDNTSLSMLNVGVRTAEKEEVYAALSVADGTAQELNSQNRFYGRMGAILNPLSDNHRPNRSGKLDPTPEDQLREDGIVNPEVVNQFKTKGFAFGGIGESNQDLLNGKARAKEAVQKNFDMDVDPNKPLFISFARLSYQKGMTFALENVEHILDHEGQIIIGGPVSDDIGKREREALLEIKSKLTQSHHKSAQNFIFIDGMVKGSLKALLLAGSDFFLIPSRYEPCGLTDAEALYNGSVPIARMTGGLNKGQNTLLYVAPNSDDQTQELRAAIDRGFELFSHRDDFQSTQVAAFAEDFSVRKNFKKFLLNNTTETYAKLMKTLDHQVSSGFITFENAVQEVRQHIVGSNSQNLVEVASALKKLPLHSQTPLMEWLIAQTAPEKQGLRGPEDLQNYEFLNLLSSRSKNVFEMFDPGSFKPHLVKKSKYQPAQGWRDIQRNRQGHATRGRFRFLADLRSSSETEPLIQFYIVGDFNSWGKKISSTEMNRYRLEQDSVDGTSGPYLLSKILPLKDGMEYRVLKVESKSVDGKTKVKKTLLTDPANLAYTTPALLKKMGRPVHEFKNSLFWDFDGPEHAGTIPPPVDWRNTVGGGVMLETDIVGLVKNWEATGTQGKLQGEIDTYSFVKNSGVIPFLAQHGITRIKFLPLAEHVEEGGWQWSYQTYPFAIDCTKGTPDELKQMIGEFSRNGIAVIFDEVVGHFPKSGNFAPRLLKKSGLHRHTRQDGSRVYGHDWDTQWGTVPYNDSNPLVVRYKNDAILSHVIHYGIGGVRIDDVSGGNNTGIRSRSGGEQYLRQMNHEVHSYNPGFYTLAEAYANVDNLTQNSGGGKGVGFNSSIQGNLQNWIELTLNRPLKDLNMENLVESLEQPYRDNQGARITYLTNHDMADNGKTFPTQTLIQVDPKRETDIPREIKSFGSLAMLSGSDFQSMLQIELGQFGHFADGVVDWSLLKSPQHAQQFQYWTDLNHYFTRNEAFNVRNDFSSHRNHVDYENKVISFWRESSSKKNAVGTLVVINLNANRENGFADYRIGTPRSGRFRLVLDSENEKYDGKSQVPADLILSAETRGLHGKSQSIVIPKLMPFQVLVFEQDSL